MRRFGGAAARPCAGAGDSPVRTLIAVASGHNAGMTRAHDFHRVAAMRTDRVVARAAAFGASMLLGLSVATAADLSACRLPGVEHDALCGTVSRPLDPSKADGARIDVHYAVLPALARRKKADPVFFFAGGPGQSAIDLAGTVGQLLARLLNRRDIVLVDQRGTGRSAPLPCDTPDARRPLRETFDPALQRERLLRCREALQDLPHGDLRQYTTPIAMADVDAVRQALGVDRINLVGGSYGTRAALEYLRQFPESVRRVVIDGVAPPDMVLPVSFSTDGQAAFDALLAACGAEPACVERYPDLRERWQRLLDGLPREALLPHPVTGQPEAVRLTRDMLAGLIRLPLYVPALASALPLAIVEAESGNFAPLAGLAGAMTGGRRAPRLAEGMHFSVVCAEDAPRIGRTADLPGADLGEGFADIYRAACAGWPRGDVPEGFYTVPPSASPVLVLSGGIDPVTPPRHGERVTKALGARARHVVVANAGHGVMPIGCARDLVFRFLDTVDDQDALVAVDPGCVERIPRPPAFRAVQGTAR